MKVQYTVHLYTEGVFDIFRAVYEINVYAFSCFFSAKPSLKTVGVKLCCSSTNQIQILFALTFPVILFLFVL